MPNDIGPFAGIMAMALTTWLTRVAGLWLMGHVPMTLTGRRMLETLPGAIVVATIVPLMARAGVPGLVGIAVTFAAMLVRRNELLAVVLGMGSVALVRAYGF
jgi:uncharacterized membrane protein